ncbi:hypothetical protein ACFL3K_00145 [Pseudomonadota bacterium]
MINWLPAIDHDTKEKSRFFFGFQISRLAPDLAACPWAAWKL